MTFKNLLQLMAEKEASDLFFSEGAPVNIKIEGETGPVSGAAPLEAAQLERLAREITSKDQWQAFLSNKELNFALDQPGIGRFRINVYRQRGAVAMVVRYIRSVIPGIEALNLPTLLKDLVMAPRGLILLVGATGSGKSTTLASMIDHRNRNKSGHILTVEDPIEYLHRHQKSIVDQREIGFDTLSYSNALVNAMREAPDVILIGEIRDRETMQHAIAYAETGHLCLSTLHANNANQTIERIINFFPDSAHKQLLLDLAQHLRAIVSQRLVPGIDARRIPAVEVMLQSAYISDLIARRDIDVLKDAIGKGRESGMQTFDQSLFDLYCAGKISEEVALEYADSPNSLSVQIRLHKGASDVDSGLSLRD